ncbi:hypothetical protein [Cognatishimia sp. MH4019]|uniref:hypothetical protein n=1 Tax=Cognatishimia sp. MH4019 TaxID=2854030 RepID=UPI001CD5B0F7|nr:hypothetical protein [Cognatishimia sp. MH4019]
MTSERSHILYPLLALLGVAAWFVVLQARGLAWSNGVFEYPLDDVYIHLAIAEQIARGGYGVNAGEYTSPGSSPLYPLLLTPFAGTDAQRWLPLFWNIVGLAAVALFWGRLIAHAGYRGAMGALLALLGPVALNTAGVAMTGMEHTLHAAASLAIVYGLFVLADEKRVSWVLLAGILLAPALRLEGLALALVGAGVLVISGRIAMGALATVLAIAPIALFVWFLTSLGLDPLPNSVQAKLVGAEDADVGRLARTIGTFRLNLLEIPGLLMLGLIAVLGALASAATGARRWVALGLAAAGLAHLFFGQIGWMERYENYILTALAAAALVLAQGAGSRAMAMLPVALLAGAGATYMPHAWEEYRFNPRAIHLQQAQTSRFVKEYLKTDVAVNDLGWVAWRNPNYVLDLWGLASHEARETRIFNPTPGWAEALVEARDVPVALIYDTEDWLAEAVGADWVLVGVFQLDLIRGFLGGAYVAAYATSPEHVTMLEDAMIRFEPHLPEGTGIIFANGFGGSR